MSEIPQGADASREAYYDWWVEKSPTDHSHHVVHGTKGSIEALKAMLAERDALRQMMQRIAEDVLPDPVRYDDLTPEMVMDAFIQQWNALRIASDEDARALLHLSDLLTAAEAERDALRADAARVAAAVNLNLADLREKWNTEYARAERLAAQIVSMAEWKREAGRAESAEEGWGYDTETGEEGKP